MRHSLKIGGILCIKKAINVLNVGKEHILKKEPKERVYCDDCFLEYREEYKKIVSEYTDLKQDIMFETALRTMEKSNKCYMYEYYDVAKELYKDIKNKKVKFLSSDEIITAIVLSGYNFEYEVNYKVLNYEVDFYIPELKVCLEIDGDRHKFNVSRDSKRDVDIRTYLGLDWEIVRIPTNFLEENPEKLIEAIETLVGERKKRRLKYNGYTPYKYSRYEDEFYKSFE